jgi:membrane protein YqaA with SNARE-associated domain
LGTLSSYSCSLGNDYKTIPNSADAAIKRLPKVKILTSGSYLATVTAVQEFLSNNGYPALFLLSFLASTLLPLGSEWLLVALLLKGFAPWPTIAVASIGNFLGACTSYMLGIYGSRFIEENIFRMNQSDKQRAEKMFKKFGSWSLLFTWVPIVGDPLCLVAGVMRIAFTRFSILVMTGKFLRYAVLAWATLEGKHILT